MRRRPRARSRPVLRRFRRVLRSEPARLLGAVALLPTLPVLLVPLLLLLPAALAGSAVSERLRRCPSCGLRGTLRDVTPPHPPTSGDRDWSTTFIPRVVIPRLWRCEVCGAEFEEVDGRPLRPADASYNVGT